MKKSLIAMLASACALMPISGVAKKVHTIGDSTMAEYSADRVTKGWGQMFQQFFTGDLIVNNRAKSGASSKSFYLEAPYWQSVKGQIEPGDYVLIQFAHNDEKNSGMDGDELKAYYTSVGDATNAASVDYRGTTASGTYREYLTKYVEETRALGATPILVGAICREYFTGSKIRRNGRHDLGDSFSILTANGPVANQSVPADDHTYDYPYQMRMLAQELDVPYIDLTDATRALYESYGSTMCNDLLFDGDGSTHTSAMGATLIARLAAQLLQQQGILTEYINLTSQLSVSPGTADFGSSYRGQTVVKDFNVSGFDLNPAAGTVTIAAPEGISLSLDKQTWSQSVEISYEGGNVIGTFYARCTFDNPGQISGTITISSGDMLTELPVTGECIVLEGGVETQAYWRLEKDDNCVVTGPMNAIGEQFSNMYVQRYSNPNANTVWPEWTGFEATRKTQRCLIVGDAWPAGEIDEVSDRWIQFSVQAPDATVVNIDNFSFFICGCGGNGMRSKVYYSSEPDFANPVEVVYFQSMPANNMQFVECTPVVKLQPGESFAIRVYPWYNGSATGKTVCLSDITIHGVAQDANPAAIVDFSAESEIVATDYFTAQGIATTDAHHGLTIVKRTYADGRVVVSKIVK